jgi:hypothetical protein
MGVSNLDRRVSYLDAQMIHHINVTLSDIKRDELHSLHDDLQQEIIPEIRLENAKYDKVEGGVVRRFELVAGVIARDFHAEVASRHANTELLRRKVEKAIPRHTTQLEQKLAEIEKLRAMLRHEREERQASDQAILDEIALTTASIRRAMMALVSDEEG